jgi:UDP-glucuronate 4-epimerase
MNILLTGCAGFIGFHTTKLLLNEDHIVIGVDNLNNYYDVKLKLSRLNQLKLDDKFIFIKSDIQNKNLLKNKKLKQIEIDCVINLAAQAGVRHSLKDPYSYIDSNLMGQLNILEIVKERKIKKFIYASSSSVYGGNKELPFSTKQRVDSPMSLYAATKKSTELLAECYSKLYKIQCIGLRFFTVYGPWGRPDMATFIFTKKILEKRKIDIFNFGKMKRDFTYIDDIVNGINGSILYESKKEFYHNVYNLGNNNSEDLLDFIEIIEKNLGIKAKRNFLPLQPGDVPETFAEISQSKKDLKFKPTTKIKDGIPKFIKWYKSYYKIN